MKKEKNNIGKVFGTASLIILVSLISGVIGFFFGSKYQTRKMSPQFMGQRLMNKNTSNRIGKSYGPLRAGLPISGKIASVDGKTITVNTDGGGSAVLILTDSSQVNKSQKASIEDAVIGERVVFSGLQNSDGTFEADTILIGSFNFPIRGNAPQN